jgi:NADH-quinone oxidoreductase subunit G
MKMINVTINDKKVQVEEGTTILDAAKELGINIPTLCHLDLNAINMETHSASCRVCVVEVANRRNLAPACATKCTEGMVIYTNSIKAIRARRTIVELLLSDHPQECTICDKNMKCQLQSIAAKLGIREIPFKGEISKENKYTRSKAIKRNPAKCILCGNCVEVCSKVQTVNILSAVNRGFSTSISSFFGDNLDETACTYCGQCVSVCPTGALTQINSVSEVWAAISDPSKYVVVQTAPAVRVALGEEFGYEVGIAVTGKMVAALKKVGFDKVFDTNFAADVTILEEATELLKRIKEGKNLPLLTSCCPGWIKFIEYQFPTLTHMPSTCKSPHEMFGAITKSYFASKMGIDPKNIVVVSVMPCLAKKYEADRPELNVDGLKDVDYVLTTREIARMIKESGINFDLLPNEPFDNPLGESSGAADIFGSTGGVIEAALRTVIYWTEGKLEPVSYKELHGMTGVKTTEVNILGKNLKIGVASGLGNARKLLEKIQNNEEHFDAIEIMACPGGCINGGGQPIHKRKMSDVILNRRMEGLTSEDRNKHIRISAKNESVLKLYHEFLGEIGGEKSHHLLHTRYFPVK